MKLQPNMYLRVEYGASWRGKHFYMDLVNTFYKTVAGEMSKAQAKRLLTQGGVRINIVLDNDSI